MSSTVTLMVMQSGCQPWPRSWSGSNPRSSLPLAARALQPERMRRIGVLMNLAERDPEGQARIAAFREGLGRLGWTEGREVQIEYRWFAGDPERAQAYAADLVKLKPEVIFARVRHPHWHRCCGKRAACQSYLRKSPIRLAGASLPAWHARAAGFDCMAHPVARTRAERADGHKSPAAKAP